ncbi:uncharacterized protein LOC126971297 [Leptidea sinapis]|uniref:uncharacterized protein LOC126971297 n=1 Tax=Leptidea sinapis TaxID=189913 RepID=UPI0021C33F30|nr:uncharacterized protein LOC126971297 [Leptidea sinapis]
MEYRSGSSHLEKQIESLLYKWREGEIKTSLFPLPSLKTIHILPIQNYYYEGMGIKMYFSSNDLNVTGVDGFSLENLQVQQSDRNLKISIGIQIPKVRVYTDQYSLKGRAYRIYPINGQGYMTITLFNVSASLQLAFGSADGDLGVALEDFIFDYDIGSIQSNLEKSSWPVNEVLNSKGVTFLKDSRESISSYLSNYVKSYINSYLKELTLIQFVKKIEEITSFMI